MRKHWPVYALLTVLNAAGIAAGQPAALPTAAEIVARMAAQDLKRQSAIEGYSGMRRYILENPGLQKRSEMLVQVRGDRDGTKHFEVVSEEGWKAANTHVLRKMLESESETSRPDLRATTRLNFANYDIQVIKFETVGGHLAYVLGIKPKRKDKYLFEGYIWVDAEDYALIRAEGSPAKNPSFWTKSTHFVQLYQKNGDLWFPLLTRSVTEVRIFGTTEVNIAYFDYAPTKTNASENSLVSVNQTRQTSSMEKANGDNQ
jgi:hypothetical protein